MPRQKSDPGQHGGLTGLSDVLPSQKTLRIVSYRITSSSEEFYYAGVSSYCRLGVSPHVGHPIRFNQRHRSSSAQGHRGTKKYQEARTDLCVSFFANPCSYSILVHGSRKICKPRHCQPDRRKTGRKDLQVLVDSCESLFTATRVQSFFSNSVKSS